MLNRLLIQPKGFIRQAIPDLARSNPIGWFTSEIWDRLTDKSLWLNQQAIKHVRDKSLVILYLVNASESPEAVPYVKAEMDILAWVNKPVIVLLNQMGEARPPEEEKAEVELWRDYLKPYSFVKIGRAHV